MGAIGWDVRTSSLHLGVGVRLHFVARMQSPGKPDILQPGDQLDFYVAMTSGGKGQVLSASPKELIIATSAGDTWRLTPPVSRDLPPSISSPGLHSQDWVIRDRV